MNVSLGRVVYELAQAPSCVALAWHKASCCTPFGVTTSAYEQASRESGRQAWHASSLVALCGLAADVAAQAALAVLGTPDDQPLLLCCACQCSLHPYSAMVNAVCGILVEGAIALPVTPSGGVLFAS